MDKERLKNKTANLIFMQTDADKKLSNKIADQITALIIKWLEEKRVKVSYGGDLFVPEGYRKDGRNQLITELVEELK